MPTAVIKLMINHFFSINFSLTKPKQPVREVIEDVDALLEELLDDDCHPPKVKALLLELCFMLSRFSVKALREMRRFVRLFLFGLRLNLKEVQRRRRRLLQQDRESKNHEINQLIPGCS